MRNGTRRGGVRRRTAIAVLPAVAVLVACNGDEVEMEEDVKVDVETASTATVELESGGSFTFEFFHDDAPKSSANFIQKARDGFFEGIVFHRVEGWVIQAGDPVTKGELGKDYVLKPDPASPNIPLPGRGGGDMPTETSDRPFEAGAVGMARGADPKITNDSQFFVLTTAARHLDNAYTNFGQVTQGMDVVRAVQIGDTIKRIVLE